MEEHAGEKRPDDEMHVHSLRECRISKCRYQQHAEVDFGESQVTKTPSHEREQEQAHRNRDDEEERDFPEQAQGVLRREALEAAARHRSDEHGEQEQADQVIPESRRDNCLADPGFELPDVQENTHRYRHGGNSQRHAEKQALHELQW